MNLENKLYKSRKNKMLGGVCGGLGEYFKIDPTLVRLGFVALCILAGGGILAYIVCLIIVPEAPVGDESATEAAAETPKTENQTPQADGGDGKADGKADGQSDGNDHTPTMI